MRINIVFGSIIVGINLFNYQRSPAYKQNDSLVLTRIAISSVIKGVIYGSFWPLPMIDMTMNFNNEKQFNRHFIPLSVYGIESIEKKA